MGLDREHRLDTELNRLLDDLARPEAESAADVPGKRTRVEQLVDQLSSQQRGQQVASGPGRRTLVERLLSVATQLSFDDFRVLALRDVLRALGRKRKLQAATLDAADRDVARRAAGPGRGSVAGQLGVADADGAGRPARDGGHTALDGDDRATRGRPRAANAPGAASVAGAANATGAAHPASGAGATGAAMWRAAERRAATLYRRAVDAGEVSAEDPAVAEALARAGNGAPLPAAVRRKMEDELGVSLDRVRVHTDAVAAQAARAVRAEAFTVGEDIFFAAGAYTPDSRAGQKLLAHELTHVVQSWEGRSDASGGTARVSQPGDPLEREADAVAERVADGAGRGEPRRGEAGRSADGAAGGMAGKAGKTPAAIEARPTAGARQLQRKPAAPRTDARSVNPTTIQPTIKRQVQRTASGAHNQGGNARADFHNHLHRLTQSTKATLGPLKGTVNETKKTPATAKMKAHGKHNDQKHHEHKHHADALKKQHHAAAEHHKHAKHDDHDELPPGEKVDPHSPIQFKKIDNWAKYMPQAMPDQDDRERARILKLVKRKIETERAESQKALAKLHAAQIKQAKAIRAMKPGLQGQIAAAQSAALGQVASAEATQAAAVAGAYAAAQGRVNGAASAAKAKVNAAYADAVAAINTANTTTNQKLTDGQTQATTDISTAETNEITAVGAVYSGARAKVSAAASAEASFASGLADQVPLPYDGDKLDAAKKAAHDTADGWAKEIPGKMQEDAEKNIYSNQGETESGVHDIASKQKDQVKTVHDKLKESLDTAHTQTLEGAAQARTQALSQIDQIAASTCASLAAQSAAQVAAVHQQAAAARAGIIKAGKSAQSSVAQACDKAAAGLENGAHGLVKGAHLIEAPNPEETQKKVKEGEAQLKTAAHSIIDGVKKSASQAAQGLTAQAAGAAKGMAGIAAGARQSSAQIAQGASQSITQAGQGAAESLHKISDGFKKQAQGISDGADKAFKGIVDDIHTAYQTALDKLSTGIDTGVQNLQKGYHDAIDSKERKAIEDNAKKAADSVKPWWQKALAFVLVIVVSIVITVVVTALTGGLGTGPVMIALIAIGSGALAGGLSSAAGQIVNNLVMGKGPFEDFSWKDVGIGALAGGLTAGLASGVSAVGGATIRAAMTEGSATFATMGGFAIRTGVNFTTGMAADAMAQLAINGKYEFSMQNMITTLGFSAAMSTTKFTEFQNKIGDGIRVKVGLDPIHVETPHIDGPGAGGGHSTPETGGTHVEPGTGSGHGTEPTGGGKTEPTGGKTEPTGGKTEPTGGKTEPTGGKTEPTGGKTEPTGGTTEPTGGKTEPTGGKTEPTGGKTEPTGGKTEPTGGTTEPTGGKTEPTGGKTEPTGGKTEPTGGKTEPTGETKPGDTKPGDTKPGDTKPGDTKPGDTKPGDTKPGDTKPGDTKPGDTKPGDTKPGDTKPGDTKPGDEHAAKGSDHDAGGTQEQKAHDDARDTEMKSDGYPEGTRSKADDTATKIEEGKTPDKEGLRDTEANQRGKEELEKLLKDPKLSPEEKAQIEKELAEKLRGESDPTGNLERDLNEVKTEVKNETKPGETKPGETKPGETKPGETKPGETTGEAKPGETKPGEVKPGETKPGETKPGETPPEAKRPEAGLKDTKLTERFVSDMKGLEGKWGSMTPQERANAVRDIINEHLREAGVPELKVKTEAGGTANGHLDFRDWAISLAEGKLNAPMEPGKMGELSNTLLHEARHGEQWYMMARHMAEGGMSPSEISARTGIPEPVCDAAAAEPKMAPGQAADAQKFYDSVYGANSGKRNQILNDLKTNGADTARAQAEYEAAVKDPSVSQAERDAKFKAWEDAYNKGQKNYQDYRNLPEEADAWATGDAAEATYKNPPKPDPAIDPSKTQPMGGHDPGKTQPLGGHDPGTTQPGPHEPGGTRPGAHDPGTEAPPAVSEPEKPTKTKTEGTPEDQLSSKGANDPVPLTPSERSQVEQYQSTRNKFLDRWREPDTSMPRETQDLLWGKADRAIRKNMTPDDLAAVVKEGRGVSINKEDGTPFNHAEEYRGARNSVVNTMEKIRARLKGFTEHGGARPGEVEALTEKLGDLSRVLDQYESVGGMPKGAGSGTTTPDPATTTHTPEDPTATGGTATGGDKTGGATTGAPERTELPPANDGPGKKPTRAPGDTGGEPPAAKPGEHTPGMAAHDWVEHLKSQLDEGARQRFDEIAKGKTPQELMDQFHGDFDAAGRELGNGAPTTQPDTATRFTVGDLPPPGAKRWAYLDEPSHWTPERAALHDRLIENAKAQARQFAEQFAGKEPTLFAMRGNTAAGKTRAVTGNVEDMRGPMAATKDLPHRSVNPDNFKADLIKETPGATSSDVHSESSMLAGRLERELLGMQTSDGKPASMLIDKRLPGLKDVQEYAKLAKESGRKFVLYDVDAPLEDSLVGVLERQPGGADPLPPFDIVADGFRAVRENRAQVIDLFSDPNVGTYHLYGTKPNGERVEVAVVENGRRVVKDEELYDVAIKDPANALATTRITRESIDTITKSLSPERAAKIRGILEKYEGWTWKAALDAHSREKPPQ